MLYPLTVFAVAVVVARVIAGVWPDLSRFGASLEYPMLPLAVYWLANLVFYGFGEETGWRGLAQPTLQRRHSALTAAVLVSLVWAGWHLPLFGITATYRSMPAIGFLGVLLQPAHCILRAGLALSAQPRQHPGCRGLPRHLRHRHDYAHDDDRRPDLDGRGDHRRWFGGHPLFGQDSSSGP